MGGKPADRIDPDAGTGGVVYCRGCRIPVKTLDHGCALCLPIKPHLVYPDTALEERHTVDSMIQETAQLLRQQLRLLKRDAARQKTATPKVTNLLSMLARALTHLVSEARKQESDKQKQLAAMPLEEQSRIVADEYFANLPSGQQDSFVERVQAIRERQRSPVRAEDSN